MQPMLLGAGAGIWSCVLRCKWKLTISALAAVPRSRPSRPPNPVCIKAQKQMSAWWGPLSRDWQQRAAVGLLLVAVVRLVLSQTGAHNKTWAAAEGCCGSSGGYSSRSKRTVALVGQLLIQLMLGVAPQPRVHHACAHLLQPLSKGERALRVLLRARGGR